VKIRGFRVEPGEIEAVLLDHPGVRQAAVTVHRPADGAASLVGHVVPEARDASDRGEVRDRVAAWRRVLDDVQTAATEGADPALAGWDSSYTGKPLPEREMREWQAATLERLRRLAPDRSAARVLEIGCGTGLLLTELAPECREYVGLDIAGKTLDGLRRRLERLNRGDNVTLLEREAGELDDLPRRGFDLVVVNSVVGYFPGVEYLLDVLRRAVEVTADGGALFVGDVRSFPLLPVFHASVELHRLRRAPGSTPIDALRARVADRLVADRELAVSPALFARIGERLPRIGAAEVLPKVSRFRNEMSMFRYDAVLRVAPQGGPETLPEPAPVTWTDWRRDGLDRARLRERLARAGEEPGRPDPPERAFGITGIPNAQVEDPVRAWREIDSPDPPATLAELRRRLEREPPAGITPFDLVELAAGAGRELRLSWAAARDDGSFDAAWPSSEAAGAGHRPVAFPTAPAGLSAGALVNHPLLATGRATLTQELGDFLAARLPEHQVPSAFVVLDELPLTPAGKVDRERLHPPRTRSRTPAPDGTPGPKPDPPRTETERAVAEIVSRVLGVERIGLRDDLEDLGAHSLTLTQISSRVRTAFGVELSLRELLGPTTVGEIADRVRSRVRSAGGVRAVPAGAAGSERGGRRDPR
jgi:SAM-dependent methyltransferase/acyl carrier protein